MDDAVESEPFLNTNTLRGILLLGGVAAVAFLAYKFWYIQKAAESVGPVQKQIVRVPIELPLAKPAVRK